MTEERLFVEIIKDTVTAWNQGTYNECFMLLSVVIAALIVALVCTAALCIGQGEKRTACNDNADMFNWRRLR